MCGGMRMATYVMSDIHGSYERYIKMLEKINFSNNDLLIIAGDVVDRGPDSCKILLDIMGRKNVEFLIGNHELMMLDGLREMEEMCGRDEWYSIWLMNGGRKTKSEFRSLRKAEQYRILNFIERAPYERYIKVNGRKFYIVHGGPEGCDYSNKFNGKKYNIVWNRVDIDNYVPVQEVDYVIFGHTPTPYYQPTVGDHYTIFKGTGQASQLIGIDCGCGADNEESCLGCLRLEDLVEFYVK